MKRILVVAIAVGMAGEASACMRSVIGYSFEDQVDNELKYLICLHNEQNDALRRQASVIRDLANEIDNKETSIQLLERKVDQLVDRVLVLELTRTPLAPPARSPEEGAELDRTLGQIEGIVKDHNASLPKQP